MRKTFVSVVASAALVGAMLVVASPPASAAAVDSFTQCVNGTGTALNCPGGWTNGTLQGSNSHYREDQVVPQRAVLTPGDTANHTLTFSYDTRRGTTHAYDSLATWNLTQATADPCQGIAASICAGAPSSLTMASDSTVVPPADAGISTTTSAHELPALSRQWVVFGGVVTAAVPVTHSSPAAGNDEATTGLTFHATSASSTIVILFGGHLARSGTALDARAWGVTLGASNVSGGPYHIRLNSLDGGSAGGTANNIQAGSVAPGAPNFTILKTASPTNPAAGASVTYTITVTNTGTASGPVTFTDNFDDRLNPSTPTSNPLGATCNREPSGTDRYFTCNTIVIAAGGGTQTFTYQATMPSDFPTQPPAQAPCVGNTYLVQNTATLSTGGTPAVANVCVSAAPAFAINKTADPTNANPGQLVNYTIVVSNTGSAPGSTTFTDDYDDRLDPPSVSVTGIGGSCTPMTILGNEVLSCTTGAISPNTSQTFTYTVAMPATFTDSAKCANGAFAVHNDATLVGVNGATSGATVCVNASPAFTISKTVTPTIAAPGATVTYTVTVHNGGSASGSTTWIDDYDDRLKTTIVGIQNASACGFVTVGTNEKLSCLTPTVNAGDDFVFKYTAVLPATYSGSAGGNGCTALNPQQYSIRNVATLPDGSEDEAVVCVNAAPNFTVLKSAPATATTGSSVQYTITVFNSGLASGITTFTDDLDPRVTFPAQTYEPAGWDCDVTTVSGHKRITCTTASIPALSFATITYQVTMPASFDTAPSGCADANSYAITNLVVLDNGQNSQATVCVPATPSFTIDKSVLPTTAQPGDVVTYTVIVTNGGTAPGLTAFDDAYDSRVTLGNASSAPLGGTCTPAVVSGVPVLHCTTSTINPGDHQTFTYTGTLDDSFGTQSANDPCGPGKFSVDNTATLIAGGASNGARVCVTAAPVFAITKTADPMVANPGQTVTYTIKVSNTGNAAGSTTFTDDFDNRLSPSAVTSVPAGAVCNFTNVLGEKKVTCTTSTIAAGGNQVFTYTAAMPATFTGITGTGCGTGDFAVKNKATLVTGVTTGDVVVCVNARPSFTIDKDAPATANPGDTITYTVTVTNGGTAPGVATFIDNYDDRLTPTTVTTTPSGGSCTPTTIGTDKVLSCTTGLTPLDPGVPMTFTYQATLPATYPETAGGFGCTASDPQQYPVRNTATLTGDTTGDVVTTCVNAAPDFTVQKFQPPDVNAGGVVTYTVKVSNVGAAAGSTPFTDNYDDGGTYLGPATIIASTSPGVIVGSPANCNDVTVLGDKQLSCTSPVLAGKTSYTISYPIRVPATFDGGAGGGCGPNYPFTNGVSLPNGQSSNVVVCVHAAPHFSFTKAADPESATPGATVTYTITVTNDGTASGATSFVDQFDPRLDPSDVVSNPDTGSCTETTVLTCNTGSIKAGESQTFTYTAVLPSSFSGPPGETCTGGRYPVTNNIVRGEITETHRTVCVSTSPAFTLAKSADPTDALPGQSVTYTVRVTNTGSGPGSTTFIDDPSELVTVLPATVTGDKGGLCTAALVGTNHVLSCHTGTLDPQESEEFVYTLTMPPSFSGDPGGSGCDSDQYPVSNTASLSNSDGATPTIVCVTAKPELSITKTANKASANPGETVTYTVTVTNSGDAPGTTSFTDDFDDRVTLNLADVTISGTGGSCSIQTVPTNDKVLKCTTGSIAANSAQTFTYKVTLPLTFDASPGGSGCAEFDPEQYPITNTAKIDNGGAADPVTVCVNASPRFTVTKSAAPNPAQPGQTVTYTITVTNGGSASGRTSFTDFYDARLNPSAAVSNPTGGVCHFESTEGGPVQICKTPKILAGGSITFTYTAQMPATFGTQAGGSGCTAINPQQYPVSNTVILDNGEHADRSVCVNASPVAKTVKSVTASNDTQGNQFLTYTLVISNTGAAASNTTVLRDPVPAGTSYVSCTGGCIPPSATNGNTVSWSFGSIPAKSDAGPVTFVVLVTATTFCDVTNTAFLQFDDYPPVASNTVVTTIQPPDNPGGAHASGTGTPLNVLATGIVGLKLGPVTPASSSRNGLGTPGVAANGVLALSVPTTGAKLLTVNALTATSTSVVAAHPPVAFQNTAAEVARICIAPVAGLACGIESGTIRAVAGTMATGGWASYSSAGSTIEGLKVLGLPLSISLNQTTTIPLNPLLFGIGSYIAIGERKGSAGYDVATNTWRSDLTVTMLHIKITGLLGVQALDVEIAKATAHTDFPRTLVCGPLVNKSVSGYASVARIATAPQIADVAQGYVELPPTGGTETQHIVGVNAGVLGGTLVSAAVADTTTTGTLTATSAYSMSRAEIAGDGANPICVIKVGVTCVVTAKAIKVQSQTQGNALGIKSTDSGTTFVGLSVLGIPIAATVAPNTVIGVPGIGGLILNEQFCDNGTYTYTHTCTGVAGHGGLTVRALHLIAVVPYTGPGVEVVVAEAHSDVTYRSVS